MDKYYLIIFVVVIVVVIVGTIIFFMIDRTSAPESEIAKASAEFKANPGFRQHAASKLVPHLRIGMSTNEVENLLGKPGSTRFIEDKEYWSYTLFYSQATHLVFDAHGKLIKIDGYGKEKWRKENIDSLITQLKKGMTVNDVSLIFGPPDRVAHSHSIDGLITTYFYKQISPSPIAIEFEKEKLKSVSGYGRALWEKQKGE